MWKNLTFFSKASSIVDILQLKEFESCCNARSCVFANSNSLSRSAIASLRLSIYKFHSFVMKLTSMHTTWLISVFKCSASEIFLTLFPFFSFGPDLGTSPAVELPKNFFVLSFLGKVGDVLGGLLEPTTNHTINSKSEFHTQQNPCCVYASALCFKLTFWNSNFSLVNLNLSLVSLQKRWR